MSYLLIRKKDSDSESSNKGRDRAKSSKNKEEIIDLFRKNFENYINLPDMENSHVDSLSMSMYFKTIFTLLNKNKNNLKSLTEEELKSLQKKIETYTTNFDEASIYKNCICLLKLLIVENKRYAMDFIKQDKYNLSEAELAGLNIHVLGSVFIVVKDLPVVRFGRSDGFHGQISIGV